MKMVDTEMVMADSTMMCASGNLSMVPFTVETLDAECEAPDRLAALLADGSVEERKFPGTGRPNRFVMRSAGFATVIARTRMVRAGTGGMSCSTTGCGRRRCWLPV